MSYALIRDGVVVNAIEAGADFAAGLTGYDAVVECGAEVGIGWAWDGAAFTPPPEPPPVDPPPPTEEELRQQAANEFLVGFVGRLK